MNFTWLYAGALYALAVWLARRGGVELPRRVALLFYLLVLLFLFRPMTGDYVNVATDVPQLIPPWSASAPGLTKYQISNFETQDVPMQLVPWMHQVREAWRSGRLPLWNDLTGCGYPLLGNGQAQALSPLRLLTLPLPLKYAIAAEGAMKILIALTFTFLYCRRRRYGLVPSVIAAVCFGFGPFVIVWLNFAIATVAVFLPAVLYAIDLLAEKRTPARFAFAAAMGPLVVFGGHPETALHIAAFAAAYAIVGVQASRPQSPGVSPGDDMRSGGTPDRRGRDARTPRWRFLAALAGAAIVSALLALPMLVAMAEAIPQSFRYQQVRQWSREVPFSDFPSLALLVQPRLFGRHDPAGAESITGFAGILGIAAWLAIAAGSWRQKRRVELFFVLASLFVFLVLANWHPATRLADVVFGLAANMRLRFLLAFMLAVLTGALVDRGGGIAVGAGLVFAATLLIYVFHRAPAPIGTAIPSVIVLAMALLLFVPVARKFAPWLVLVAVIAELWPVTIAWNPVRPASTFYPRTPLIDAVTRAHHRNVDRVAGIGSVFFPNTNVLFGIEDVRFHDPMVPARYVAAAGVNTRDYFMKWTDASAFDALNARWVLAEPAHDLGGRFILRYDRPDGRLYENPRAKARFYSDEAKVTITIASPMDYMLVVDAPREARVKSSVGWARGWRVEGGRPEASPTFVEFTVPAGHSTVRVHYAPLHIYAALAIALVTALALAAYIIRARV